MPIKNLEKRKEYNRQYHLRWYADEQNAEKRKKQARDNRKVSKKRNKAFILEYKLAHPCKCGESRPQCLDFHHASAKKEYGLSEMVNSGFGLEKIKAEIAKCEVVCKNCHADIHHRKKA